MEIGDRFFTIAYVINTKVVEVEIIELDNSMDGKLMVHFQRVYQPWDKWYLTTKLTEQWKFNTREEAEVRLKELDL